MNNSWNVVLNKMIEIKQTYLCTFGNLPWFTADRECNTIMEYWVKRLNIPEYIELCKPLQFSQNGYNLLIRYGSFSSIYGGEESTTPQEFWNLYEGFYRECRSVVIDLNREQLVLTPYKKFFNMNELPEVSEDKVRKLISSSKTLEFSDKLDGSMVNITWYNNGINEDFVISTSQSLNDDTSWRLTLSKKIFNTHPTLKNMVWGNPGYTFMFELIHPSDLHIVSYDETQSGLYLIGIRSIETGVELPYSSVLQFAEKYKCKSTVLKNTTLDNLLNSLDTVPSNQAEGFVINIDGIRIKLKYNDYVFMHRTISSLVSLNYIIYAIAEGKFDDLISKIPGEMHRTTATKIASKVYEYIHYIENQVDTYYALGKNNHGSCRKDFMLWVQSDVPTAFRKFVIAKYNGIAINYLKRGSTTCPHYLSLGEMGISIDDDME